jgi:F0F1-type ATP synthase assembly protein I
MFGFCIGLGVFGGVLLDRALGTSPLLALLGVAIGIVVGATGAFQVIRPYTQSSTNGQSGLKRSTEALSKGKSGTGNPARLATAEPDDDVRSDEQ